MKTTYPETETSRLADYAALEYILLGDLRDLLEEPADEQNRRWLRAVLDALLDTLPRAYALHLEGGYLSEVVDRFPNWGTQVDDLREEKARLYEKLRQCRQVVVRHASYASVAEELRAALRDWMTSFVAHQRHERRLVQTAFNMEVGAGD